MGAMPAILAGGLAAGAVAALGMDGDEVWCASTLAAATSRVERLASTLRQRLAGPACNSIIAGARR